jgi:hypothetical protein
MEIDGMFSVESLFGITIAIAAESVTPGIVTRVDPNPPQPSALVACGAGRYGRRLCSEEDCEARPTHGLTVVVRTIEERVEGDEPHPRGFITLPFTTS